MNKFTGMSIGIIGFGALGEKIGIFLTSKTPISDVILCSNKSNKERNYPPGILKALDNVSLAQRCRTILLCVKPGQIKEVCEEIYSSLSEGDVVISCAAVVPLSKLESYLPKTVTVIRCMPNILTCIGKGTLVYYSNSDNQHDIMKNFFLPNNLISVSNDDSVDCATILAGCAPAFWAWFYDNLSKSMSDKVPNKLIKDLLLQSMEGSARLLTLQTPQEIIKSVASPGGMTEKALTSMQNNNIQASLQAAYARIADIRDTL